MKRLLAAGSANSLAAMHLSQPKNTDVSCDWGASGLPRTPALHTSSARRLPVLPAQMSHDFKPQGRLVRLLAGLIRRLPVLPAHKGHDLNPEGHRQPQALLGHQVARASRQVPAEEEEKIASSSHTTMTR